MAIAAGGTDGLAATQPGTEPPSGPELLNPESKTESRSILYAGTALHLSTLEHSAEAIR